MRHLQLTTYCVRLEPLAEEDKLKPVRGTSLVEIILYVGLTATILLGISSLIASTLSTRVKSQTVSEVDSQGLMAMQIITQSIRNAQAINSPIGGATSSTLSLRMSSALIDPTIYNLATGAIRVSEGVGQPISLTNPRVVASELIFYNYSRPGTPGIIQIRLTLTYLNPQNTNEYDYSKTFISSAGLR